MATPQEKAPPQQPTLVDITDTLTRIRSVRYPEERGDPSGDKTEQRHFVRFTINIDEESKLIKRGKIEATDVDKTGQNRISERETSETRMGLAGAAIGASVAGTSEIGKSLINRLSGFKGGKALATFAVAGTGAGIGAMAAKQFGVSKKLKKLGAIITLYNSGNIRSSHDIRYDDTENLITDFLSSGRGEELVQDLKAEASKLSMDSLNNGDPVRGLATATASTAGKFARILATNASPDVLGLMSRTAKNPKKDVLFKEVGPRRFQFEYTFMPRTATEANDVRDIIFMFKYFSHPEMLEGFDTFLYIYPAEFDIEYIFVNQVGEEVVNEHLNRISSCVLESVHVTYGGQGTFQSLIAGEPIVTNLVLQFREIETLHQDRIAAGY